jgi:hypothetical protein
MRWVAHLSDDADEPQATHERAALLAVASAGVDVPGAVHPGDPCGKESLACSTGVGGSLGAMQSGKGCRVMPVQNGGREAA